MVSWYHKNNDAVKLFLYEVTDLWNYIMQVKKLFNILK